MNRSSSASARQRKHACLCNKLYARKCVLESENCSIGHYTISWESEWIALITTLVSLVSRLELQCESLATRDYSTCSLIMWRTLTCSQHIAVDVAGFRSFLPSNWVVLVVNRTAHRTVKCFALGTNCSEAPTLVSFPDRLPGESGNETRELWLLKEGEASEGK